MSITRSRNGTARRTVAANFSKSKTPPIDVAREVDGTEIADRGFRLRRDFGDFRAEIREMNDISAAGLSGSICGCRRL